MIDALLILLMVICGTASHFLKDIIRIKHEQGRFVNFKEYWYDYPYQNLLYVVNVIAGVVITQSMDMLNPAMAFGIGVAANSFADGLGKRAVNKV